MGPDTIILVFWMLSFKPTFSLSSFTFIKRLFSSSSLSAIRVVSSAYLRLLIFLPAILIPACASSSPAFLTMYSAYKLNKQGDKGVYFSIFLFCVIQKLGEQHWNIYITICEVDRQWKFGILCRELNTSALWQQPRRGRWGGGWEVGGRFKREETYVYLWLIYVDVWQKPTQYCKIIIIQLKINFKTHTQ